MHSRARGRWLRRSPLILCERDEWGELQLTRSALGCELRFDGGALQGRVDLREPWVPLSEYAVTMSLAPALLPAPLAGPLGLTGASLRVGLLGLGTGNLAWAYQRALPSCELTLVELRPAVLKAARRGLRLDELERSATLNAPAEEALKGFCERSFELLAVDLFLSTGMAPPLMTPEFWGDLFSCLAPQGVACVNLWSSNPEAFQRALKLIRAHRGPHRVTLGVSHLSFSNVVLFICSAPRALEEVARRAARLDELLSSGLKLTRKLRKARREAGLSGEPLYARAERLTLM